MRSGRGSPSQPTRLHAWRTAATAIQEYRDRWGVQDPTEALGQPPTDLSRRLDYDHAAAAVQQAQQNLTIATGQLNLDLAL